MPVAPVAVEQGGTVSAALVKAGVNRQDMSELERRLRSNESVEVPGSAGSLVCRGHDAAPCEVPQHHTPTTIRSRHRFTPRTGIGELPGSRHWHQLPVYALAKRLDAAAAATHKRYHNVTSVICLLQTPDQNGVSANRAGVSYKAMVSFTCCSAWSTVRDFISCASSLDAPARIRLAASVAS